jgi:hypothetical protein
LCIHQTGQGDTSREDGVVVILCTVDNKCPRAEMTKTYSREEIYSDDDICSAGIEGLGIISTTTTTTTVSKIID